MIDYYLFINHESGEQFVVECHDFEECQQILADNEIEWETVEPLRIYTPTEAEILGYDTF